MIQLPPPPGNGEKRQWVQCRTCKNVSYYDYLPNSFSRPILALPCAHDAGCRSIMDVADRITEPQALSILKAQDRIKDICIQEKDRRITSLGNALYIRVYTDTYRQLPWRDVWDAFSASYPGQWAVQFFPPADEMLDEENIYHLFVLDDAPSGVNIKQRDPVSP